MREVPGVLPGEGEAMRPVSLWGAMWRSDNRLSGKTERLLWMNPKRPALFDTRREAREWIAKGFGYIKDRPDLRREPHGWKMPVPVRVRIEKEE